MNKRSQAAENRHPRSGTAGCPEGLHARRLDLAFFTVRLKTSTPMSTPNITRRYTKRISSTELRMLFSRSEVMRKTTAFVITQNAPIATKFPKTWFTTPRKKSKGSQSLIATLERYDINLAFH